MHVKRLHFADLPLVTCMFFWSLIVPLLKKVLPIEVLTRLMWTDTRRTAERRNEDFVVRLSRKLTTDRPFLRRDNCLDRSLIAYRFLSRLGADPKIFLGIKENEGKIEGHAWVLVNGHPIHDEPRRLTDFVVLAAFGNQGRSLQIKLPYTDDLEKR